MNGCEMTFTAPPDLADVLSHREKFLIYFSRVVDLAVASGLLDPAPDTETGHFAFSAHYHEGKGLDRELREAIRECAVRFPRLVDRRTADLDEAYDGIASRLRDSAPTEKLHALILIGAMRDVWPAGTSTARGDRCDFDPT